MWSFSKINQMKGTLNFSLGCFLQSRSGFLSLWPVTSLLFCCVISSLTPWYCCSWLLPKTHLMSMSRENFTIAHRSDIQPSAFSCCAAVKTHTCPDTPPSHCSNTFLLCTLVLSACFNEVQLIHLSCRSLWPAIKHSQSWN